MKKEMDKLREQAWEINRGNSMVSCQASDGMGKQPG